jgi:uncharacterized protein
MRDDQFEWDDAKAARNWRIHGVTFDMAREAFRDVFMVEWVDDGQDIAESRFVGLGVAERRLLCVAYTLRGERIRIISARKAEAHEQRRYHEDNREA